MANRSRSRPARTRCRPLTICHKCGFSFVSQLVKEPEMPQYKCLAIILAAPALAALTLLSGCAGGDEKKPAASSTTDGTTKVKTPPIKKVVTELAAATDGV